MKKQKLIIPFLLLSLYSCQKEISTEVSNTNTSTQVDVYVAGFVSDEAKDKYPWAAYYYEEHPVYWKNGSRVQLEYDDVYGDQNEKHGRAYSIAVSGSNVYVAGYGVWNTYNYGPKPYGAFWKNGIPLDRDSMNMWDTFLLFSLAVSNNDVYVTGARELSIAYWKNENPVELGPRYTSTSLPILGTTRSIAVSGNDVYVSGYQKTGGGGSNYIAAYWKNGTLVKLTDGSKDTYANSIAVSGTDVYVAGSDIVYTTGGVEGVAKSWKKGTLVNLTDGSTAAEANSVAVSGTDVYVAGTQWDGNAIQNSNGFYFHRNPIAKYWKNGKPVNLTDGSKWAEARSIVISGNDVYVAGSEDGVAKYWKNGTAVILGDASKYSEAYSIFLVKK